MIVLARLLRRTECMAQVVPQPMPTTAAPKHCHDPLSCSAPPNPSSGSAPNAGAQKRRKRVRVEGLYLEREPEPVLHARALLQLIQEECPEKVGSYIPRSHLERLPRAMRSRRLEGTQLDDHRACARHADLQEAFKTERRAICRLPSPCPSN
jgi:hypothetical protein